MSYTNKPFEALNIMDDFMMNAIATNEDVGVPFCRRLLSVLLQREIGQLRVVAQRTIPALTPNLRGIRMDVEIEEFGDISTELPVMSIYDLEPHLQKNTNLSRHNRFYQAKIDSRYLKSGERNFSKLPKLYVLTFTDFDPFGFDYMMYTVQNQCLEVPMLDYNDGLQFLYFYPNGSKGGNAQIKAMLQYMQDSNASNVTDEATKEVHNYVNQVKILPEVKIEYMKFDEIIQYEREDAAREATEKATEIATRAAQVQSVVELLEDFGKIPESLTDYLRDSDSATLKKYLKIAAKADSIVDFAQKAGLTDIITASAK